MLGYKLPFDRHDWIVDRCGREVSSSLLFEWNCGASRPSNVGLFPCCGLGGCGGRQIGDVVPQVRYVIDFYNAAPLPGMPIAMHLDTRPALDSPGALLDRLRMQAKWVASGRWARE